MFSRSEAIALTGLTAGQLNYLDSVGIVCPEKPHIRKCSFSWEQILELRVISKLRKTISLQKIRDAKKFLEDIDFTENNLFNNKIVASDKEIYLVSDKEDFLVTISGKFKGQMAIKSVIFCDEIIKELYDIGKNSNKVIDFEKKLDKSGKQSHRILELVKAS